MPNNLNNKKVEDVFSGLEVSEPQQTVEQPKPELKPQIPDKPLEQPIILPELVKPIKLEKVPQKDENPSESSQPKLTSATKTVLPPIYPKVEKILEENLAEAYFKMPSEKQKEFKIKGEETTLKISQLLQNTKFKVKQIFKLIINWLSIIPGVNKHFLEQEAKIKTDKLLIVRNKELRK